MSVTPDIEGWAQRTAPAGAWFDARAAEAACAFFPAYLVHTEGEWAGHPFELACWERAIVRAAFGWKLAPLDKGSGGSRRFRTLWLEVARKNGKTELASGLALLLLLGDGEMGAQVYTAAVDKDQAKISFNKASVMAQLSKALSAELDVLKTAIYSPAVMGAIKPLSSAPGTKHGFSPSGLIADEIHEWPSRDLYQVVHDGEGARRQPLEIMITTAGEREHGFGWEMHDYATKVLGGEIVDAAFLPVIFAIDETDDWTDESVWAKANPNLGISPKLEFLRAQCAAARALPRLENNFRRYHLNQWTEQTTRWLPMHEWAQCAGPAPWDEICEHLVGRDCFTGIDLAQSRDLSAIVHVFPPEAEPIEQEGEDDAEAILSRLWVIVPRFYLPRATLKKRVDNAARIDDYRRWAERGALTLTEGDDIDYATIEADIVADAERFRIRELPFDPYTANQLAQDLLNLHGLLAVKFPQHVAHYNEPSKAFEAKVLAHEIAHGDHPVMNWMAQNAAVYEDPRTGMIKPDKFKTGAKIDGIVAAVMALGRATVAEPDPGFVLPGIVRASSSARGGGVGGAAAAERERTAA